LFYNIIKRRKNDDKIETRPFFYWKILMSVFIIGLISAVLFNLYFFFFLNKIEVVSLKDNDFEAQKIKKEKIDEIVKELDKRETELLNLLEKSGD